MSNISIVLILLFIILWLAILTLYLYKTVSHYRKLTHGVGRDDLSNILEKLIDNYKKAIKNTQELEKKIMELTHESKFHIQKVGIRRFNPFSDTGGNQSFVLSILDSSDTGIVLTSLHTRGVTRWYAKNVKMGKGIDHELSKEEIQAIKSAVSLKENELDKRVKRN